MKRTSLVEAEVVAGLLRPDWKRLRKNSDSARQRLKA